MICFLLGDWDEESANASADLRLHCARSARRKPAANGCDDNIALGNGGGEEREIEVVVEALCTRLNQVSVVALG